MSAKLSTQAGESLAQGAAIETRAGESDRKASERSYDAAFSTALRATQQSDAGKRLSRGWGSDLSTSTGLSKSEEDSFVKRIMEKTGISDDSVVRKSLEAGTPSVLPIPIRAGASSAEQESLKREVAVDFDAARRLGAQRKRDFVEQYRQGESFEQVRSGNRSAASSVDASVREAEGYRTSAETHFARAESLSQKWEGFQRYVREFGAEADVVVDRFFQSKGYSPHNGVFDGMHAAKYLTELAGLGTVRFDTADGRPLWIPPDPSAVYHAPNEGELRQMNDTGVPALRQHFDQQTPGGGRAAISAAGNRDQRRALAQQSTLGVSPTFEPDGSAVTRNVDRDRLAAAAEVDGSSTAARTEEGRLALDYKHRSKAVSDNHTVGKHIGLNKGANPAAEAVSATASEAFPSEAEAERRRREQEAISEARTRDRLKAQLDQLPQAALPVRPK